MIRTILHCDLNNFYASVECLYRPDLRGKPVAVSGDVARRDVQLLKLSLGVWGETLHNFANGLDQAPVAISGEESFVKSVGNSTTTPRDLVSADGSFQLDLFEADSAEQETLERTVDGLRERFGPYCIQRCALLLDGRLTGFNPKDDHVIHPVSFFR